MDLSLLKWKLGNWWKRISPAHKKAEALRLMRQNAEYARMSARAKERSHKAKEKEEQFDRNMREAVTEALKMCKLEFVIDHVVHMHPLSHFSVVCLRHVLPGLPPYGVNFMVPHHQIEFRKDRPEHKCFIGLLRHEVMMCERKVLKEVYGAGYGAAR
ncbi:hypothetical protein D3C84_965530 [compost metagenome]